MERGPDAYAKMGARKPGQQQTQGQHNGTAEYPVVHQRTLGGFRSSSLEMTSAGWCPCLLVVGTALQNAKPYQRRGCRTDAEKMLSGNSRESSSDDCSKDVPPDVGLGIDVEILGRVQQLQAQLDGDVHVGHVLLVPVTVPVVEVLYYLFEHDGTVGEC